MSDPYAVQQALLREAFYVDHGKEWNIILTLLYVLEGIGLLVALTSIGLRVFSGKLWLFRVAQTGSSITLLLPNSLVFWLLSSVAYHSFALYYTWRTWISGSVGGDMINYVFCISTPWLAMWIGGLFWAWSTTLAPFLLPQGNPDPSRRYTVLPVLITLFYSLTLLGCAIPVLTYALLANKEFNRLFVLFKAIDQVLSQASLDLSSGKTSLLPDPTTLAEGQAIFMVQFNKFANRWISLWQTWVSLDFLMLVVYVGALYLAHRELLKAIETLRRTKNASGDTQYSRKMARLVWNQRSLWFSGVLCTVFLTNAIGFVMPLAVRSSSIRVLHGDRLTEVLRLSSLLSAALLTVTSDIAILALSLDGYWSKSSHDANAVFRRGRSKASSPFNSTGSNPRVEVTVEVQLHEVKDFDKSNDGMSKRLEDDL